jgi:hypothetical protein
VRLKAVRGALPLGAVLAAIGLAAALAVAAFHLDHLPFSLCLFKAVTGLPCLTWAGCAPETCAARWR